MPLLPLLLTLAAQGGQTPKPPAPKKPAPPKSGSAKGGSSKGSSAQGGSTQGGSTQGSSAQGATAKAATIPPVAQLSKTDTKVGTGPEARMGDVVDMEYVGTLVNGGKEFDRSREVPFRFSLGMGEVIRGWDQGILGMKEGGERTLLIPSRLAYGAQGAGNVIPPNADLKFTVKLLRILPRAKVETLTEGKGETVVPGDALEFHFKGMLADGKVFDSTYERQQPLQVELSSLALLGLKQGLLGMKVGEKRRITIPPDLGFGVEGAPRQDMKDESGKVVQAKGSFIPGGATISFEVELLRILAHRKSE